VPESDNSLPAAASTLNRAFEALVTTLSERGIDYAIIGGMALIHHTRVRATDDIDVLLSVTQMGMPGLFEALRDRGFQIDLARNIRELRDDGLTSLRFEHVHIDLMRPMLPTYAHILNRAIVKESLGKPVRVSSAEGLIIMKVISARPQDESDVRELLEGYSGKLDLDFIRCELGRVLPADDPRRVNFEVWVREVELRSDRDSRAESQPASGIQQRQPETAYVPLANYFRKPELDRALERYGTFTEDNGWPLSHKAEMYRLSSDAFATADSSDQNFEAFKEIYDKLRGYWQVFRNAQSYWSAKEIFDVLTKEFGHFSRQSDVTLASFGQSERESLVTALPRLAGLKQVKSGGYPFMPVAKFLHFFNPRLFPIYDTAVICNIVFKAFKDDWSGFIEQERLKDDQGCPWLANYVLWAARLVKAGDQLLMNQFATWFGNRLSSKDPNAQLPADLDKYYAAAFEFVAIGAAHLEQEKNLL
jgi:hypothetical protein